MVPAQLFKATNTQSSERRSMRNMSLGKTELSCSKFQANVFDKSRCQNCFKFRELHVTTCEQLEQVKPIYASWLCLAPEGTDFENPMQRSRKWQRRFFILYQHGSLQFALDESASTIPQGTIDLNLCTNVIDAEGRTRQKNALCIITPHQEIFIRGDSREIINGWCEQLLAFKQTNEQKQSKKRSKASVPFQGDVCMDKAVCDTGTPVDCNGQSSPGQDDEPYQEMKDTNNVAADFPATGKVKPRDMNHQSSSTDTRRTGRGSCLQLSSPEPWGVDGDHSLSDLALSSSSSSLDWQVEDTESCANKRDQPSSLIQAIEKDREKHLVGKHEEDPRFTKSSLTEECLAVERQYQMFDLCSSKDRGGRQNHCVQTQQLKAPQRRSRSLDVKTLESTMTPDLLNFKKGWLFRLDDHELWRKYWFVLSAYSLRYYFDLEAEEASQLVGEIDLTSCYKVTNLHIQRNYGFQICTHKGVYTLAAMTAGIRQNWITALTKNMQNHDAPDVASLSDNCLPKVEPLPTPDVTKDSLSIPGNNKHCPKRKSDRNRRCRIPVSHLLTHKGRELEDLQTAGIKSKRRGREERKKRYAVMMRSLMHPGEERNGCTQDQQQQQQQGPMREIEEYWLRVEKMAIRMEKSVPLYPVCQSESAAELKKLLEHYNNRIEKLKLQLKELANQSYSQEHEYSRDCTWQRKSTYDLGVQCDLQEMGLNKQNPIVMDKYQETNGLLQLQHLGGPSMKDQSDLYSFSQFRSESRSERDDITSCHASLVWEDEDPWTVVELSSEMTQKSMKDHNGSDAAVTQLFSQEPHFLTKHNEALNQRNQELMNQLAEADREIDRLKAELVHQVNDHQSELESVVECLEMELASNCRQLEGAQTQLAVMEESLKDAHRTLQLREATLGDQYDLARNVTSPEITDRLRRCVQMLETKLSELESQAWISGLVWDRQSQNARLTKSELNNQRIMEAEEKSRTFERQSEELKPTEDQQYQNKLKSKEAIENALKEQIKVFSTLLEVSNRLSGHEMQESASENEPDQINPRVVKRLQIEKDIWECFVNILKDPSLEKGAGCLLQGAEMKLEEVNVYLSVLYSSTNTSSVDSEPNISASKCLSNLEVIGTGKVSQNDRKTSSSQKLNVLRGLNKQLEERLALLNHVASKMNSFTNNELYSTLNSQSATWRDTNEFHSIASAAMDLIIACMVDTTFADQSSLPLALPVCKDSKSILIQTENRDIMLEEREMADLYERVNTEIISSLKSRVQELENLLRESAETLTSLKLEHEQDKERIKTKITAAYEEGFTLLKESHRKTTEDLLLKHHRDLKLLEEEKERLLTEEASATLTTIEAMKRAHCAELERVLQKACGVESSDADIAVILQNHSEEMSAVHRELDALSEQYTQKCLENVHLTKVLQAERDVLQQCRCKIQALSIHNQELRNQFAEEIVSRLSSLVNGSAIELVDGERYELELRLQLKESEVICLQQEIETFKRELDAAQMDLSNAADRYQKMEIDLRLVKETAEEQIAQLNKNLNLVNKALAESKEVAAPAPTLPLILP